MTTFEQTSHRAAWITLGLLFAGALYLCLVVLRPFAAPLLTGVMIASLSYPLHRLMLFRMPKHPTVAAFCTSALVVLLVVVPIGFAGGLAAGQIASVIEGMGAEDISDGASRIWASLEAPLDTMGGWFGTNAAEMRELLFARLREFGAAGGRFAVTLAGSATDAVIKGAVALLTLFFGLRDGPRFVNAVVQRSPLGMERTHRLLTAAADTIYASFWGVIAVSAVQGVLVYLGAWFAGLPAPALWGLGAGVASVIPIFGSALAWLPGSIYLLIQGNYGMGVFLLIWGAVVVANSDNVVRPLVLMSRVPANPLVVFIAILGGVQAFGLLGLLLGPVILGVTLSLIDMVREEMDDGRLVK